MGKHDFGRFRNRGANNPRFTIGNTEPEDPVNLDVWINPEIVYQYKQKSAAQGFTSTTQATVTDLGATLGAGGTYKVDLTAFVWGPTTDVEFDWNFVCATTPSIRGCLGPGPNSTDAGDTTMRASSHNLATDVRYGLDGAGVTALIKETFIVTTTTSTGSVQARVAQYSSTTTIVTVTANSYLEVTPIVSNMKYYDELSATWKALL